MTRANMRPFLVSPLSVSIFLLSIHELVGDDIIGGTEAVPHSRPYMAFIRCGNKNICGGILIKSKWVLTAAHCNINKSRARVILGAHSIKNKEKEQQVYSVLRTITHQLYNNTSFNNDIQILELNESASITKAVNVLPLPKTHPNIKPGSVCEVSGWGLTNNRNNIHSDKLLLVNVTIMDRQTCSKIWKLKNMSITENMICTSEMIEDKGTCGGDSGGPLICNGVLRGITSFGEPECGIPGDPSVYSYIHKKNTCWIYKALSGMP